MSEAFRSAADAEDAYYDAIDECDLDKMMSVWEDSDEAVCLLPMQPMRRGGASIRELWRPMLDPELKVEISVNHLQWIEQGDMAIHLLEEVVTLMGTGERQPPIYASNIYRRTNGGWHMLMHINSPAPPARAVLPPLGENQP